jgi:vacuolar fusion protein MON1
MTTQPDPPSDRRHAPVNEPLTTASDSSPSHVGTRGRSFSSEEQRPLLPPRPNTLSLLNDEATPRATLQAEPTTAVSRADVDSETPEAGINASTSLVARGLSRGLRAKASLSQLASPKGSSDAGDSASIRSSIQNGDVGDVDALFKDFVNTVPGDHAEAASLFHFPEFAAEEVDDDGFLNEFEPVGELDEDAGNEGWFISQSKM